MLLMASRWPRWPSGAWSKMMTSTLPKIPCRKSSLAPVRRSAAKRMESWTTSSWTTSVTAAAFAQKAIWAATAGGEHMNSDIVRHTRVIWITSRPKLRDVRTDGVQKEETLTNRSQSFFLLVTISSNVSKFWSTCNPEFHSFGFFDLTRA